MKMPYTIGKNDDDDLGITHITYPHTEPVILSSDSTKYVRFGYSQINGVLWRAQYNMMTTLFVQIAEARQISFRMLYLSENGAASSIVYGC